MDDATLQLAIFLLAAGVAGVLFGWLIRGAKSNRNAEQLNDEWQTKLDELIRHRDRMTTEIANLRSTIESQQADINKHEIAVARGRTNLESAYEKEKIMAKSIFTLRTEREDFKNKVAQFQNALISVKKQSAEIQEEFVKSAKFYKGELTKAFEKRKMLEANVNNAKLEHESFSNLLQASRSEHDSANKMLASAQNRLSNLDALERDVIKLETENAQLKYDASTTKQEIEVLQRDVAELDELKVQNKELAHCLKSMESSRSQYEDDAKRYKQHAEQTEHQSETLQIRLDDVEKNFADMEKQQRQALKDARNEVAAQASNGQTVPEQECDDLKEIVGIGRAFEQTLHDLGVFSYRQIARFGMSDIARVNLQLKEYKGRMEQDDWIGQAKELLFKKYG